MHNFVYNYREIEYNSMKLWGTFDGEILSGCPVVSDCPVKNWRTGSTYLEDYALDYGMDTLALYEQFVGFEKGSLDEDSYEENALDGVFNFLKKLSRCVEEHKDSILSNASESESAYKKHQEMILALEAPVKKDHPRAFVAVLMEYCNQFFKDACDGVLGIDMLKDYLIFLSILAPRHAQDSWQKLNQSGFVFSNAWPKVADSYLAGSTVVIPVQVKGKTKCELEVARDASESEARRKAISKLCLEAGFHEADLTNARCIYAPGKIINFI